MPQPSSPASGHPTSGQPAEWSGAVCRQEGWWTATTSLAPAGLRLYRQRWSGAEPPRAAMVLVHGIGGHSGLFTDLAEELVGWGLEVFAFDLPGHGRSDGPRGLVRSWSDYRDCLDQFLASEVTAARPDLACLLLGHSLGGTLVLDAVLDPDEASTRLIGAVVSNPAVGETGAASWRLLCARLLSRIWPSFTLSTGFPLKLACRDPIRLEAYRRDPYRHTLCSARLATEFLAVAGRLQTEAPRITLPLLLLQSGADGVTPPAAAERFFAGLPEATSTWRFYPASFHELFDDLDRQEVLADLRSWIEALLAVPAGSP
ncbi:MULTISPECIES: alpha/beta hydrolase [unclassified Synechococcus]|uniref:alpha/beta hydrolase n=1 Tax=unclassified Synechococcus TaxID=2626047 RepID=UPI0018CEEE35|nr:MULTISPECIES: alpha/beta hydrolase [unclassified Synechococcus]QPN66738.1 lysophospholipase [Synechococcus sp. CBW1006]CAK6692410.1 Monoacylglycerol lipase [Synechococcus sp. CBW1107]